MSEQPEALRLADMVLSLRSHLGPWRDESDSDEQAAWDGYTEAAAELRRLHALCVEQIKMIERINYLCADTVRTNSKDTRDWLEDVAFISRITAGHLAKWKESK